MRGDIETIRRLFAKDATFRMAGSAAASPIAVSTEGHEEVLPLIQRMIDTFEHSDFEVLSMLIDGTTTTDSSSKPSRIESHAFGMARLVADGIEVRRRLPPLSARHLARLPVSLRVLMENLLRHEDGATVKKGDTLRMLGALRATKRDR